MIHARRLAKRFTIRRRTVDAVRFRQARNAASRSTASRSRLSGAARHMRR